ncbi:uncharacterized protein LOC130638005 [Hydractinia symbiolongicarpus]|uniref:uncharacterized protein LOC130638005 n=1 Tax=Hydractinia symbiolongicarpus TaxID=13093 RepID=UPI00254D55FE|nr:uncharacterized protein LOC130638005 [Hydractinia symbiolongicarpus]
MAFSVSNASDPYNDYMAGMCILRYKGSEDFYRNGHHIQSGFILIKSISNIQNVQCDKGQVHGKLFKWLFNMDPEGCKDVDGYGFSIVDGVWKYKSWTLNNRFQYGEVPLHVQTHIRNAVQSYWKTQDTR